MYTEVIHTLLKINKDIMSPRNMKKWAKMMPLDVVYREFRTMRFNGSRQSGKTSTLIKWGNTHRSLLVVADSHRVREFRRRGDIGDNPAVCIDHIDHPDYFKNVDYVLLDEYSSMSPESINDMYNAAAKTGRHNIIFIAA